MLVHFISIFMPLFLARFKNYIEFLIQSLKTVRNLQNGILCTEFGPLCFVKSTTVYGLQ